MRKKQRVVTGCDSEDEEEDETKELNYPRISYRQLREVTGGFSASSLIGSGRFGRVYKGVLYNTRVAVK
ncbi:leucine-rich repeat receptor-like serine/threonine-protein kinase, partial [Trifolium medium]|nr:leucine-rich repeat receptor-like serine/threonine-protein kinase [Trifolium medium]